jgi:hypothetical protein
LDGPVVTRLSRFEKARDTQMTPTWLVPFHIVTCDLSELMVGRFDDRPLHQSHDVFFMHSISTTFNGRHSKENRSLQSIFSTVSEALNFEILTRQSIRPCRDGPSGFWGPTNWNRISRRSEHRSLVGRLLDVENGVLQVLDWMHCIAEEELRARCVSCSRPIAADAPPLLVYKKNTKNNTPRRN